MKNVTCVLLVVALGCGRGTEHKLPPSTDNCGGYVVPEGDLTTEQRIDRLEARQRMADCDEQRKMWAKMSEGLERCYNTPYPDWALEVMSAEPPAWCKSQRQVWVVADHRTLYCCPPEQKP